MKNITLEELKQALPTFKKGKHSLGDKFNGFCCLGVGMCLIHEMDPEEVNEPLFGENEEYPTQEELLAMGFPGELLSGDGSVFVPNEVKPNSSVLITEVNDHVREWPPVMEALDKIIEWRDKNV